MEKEKFDDVVGAKQKKESLGGPNRDRLLIIAGVSILGIVVIAFGFNYLGTLNKKNVSAGNAEVKTLDGMIYVDKKDSTLAKGDTVKADDKKGYVYKAAPPKPVEPVVKKDIDNDGSDYDSDMPKRYQNVKSARDAELEAYIQKKKAEEEAARKSGPYSSLGFGSGPKVTAGIGIYGDSPAGGSPAAVPGLPASLFGKPSTPQDKATEFASNTKNATFEGMLTPQMIGPGTMIDCTLRTKINSDLPGQIIAEVNTNVYDTLSGRNVLIPQGTRVIAQYNNVLSWGQNRIQMAWKTLVRPDGFMIDLGSLNGVDLSGASGVPASWVDGHGWEYMAALGVVLGSDIAVQELAYDATLAPTVGLQKLGGAAASTITPAITQAGADYMSKTQSRPQTVTVNQGVRIGIMCLSPITLPTFKGVSR